MQYAPVAAVVGREDVGMQVETSAGSAPKSMQHAPVGRESVQLGEAPAVQSIYAPPGALEADADCWGDLTEGRCPRGVALSVGPCHGTDRRAVVAAAVATVVLVTAAVLNVLPAVIKGSSATFDPDGGSSGDSFSCPDGGGGGRGVVPQELGGPIPTIFDSDFGSFMDDSRRAGLLGA